MEMRSAGPCGTRDVAGSRAGGEGRRQPIVMGSRDMLRHLVYSARHVTRVRGRARASCPGPTPDAVRVARLGVWAPPSRSIRGRGPCWPPAPGVMCADETRARPSVKGAGHQRVGTATTSEAPTLACAPVLPILPNCQCARITHHRAVTTGRGRTSAQRIHPCNRTHPTAQHTPARRFPSHGGISVTPLVLLGACSSTTTCLGC